MKLVKIVSLLITVLIFGCEEAKQEVKVKKKQIEVANTDSTGVIHGRSQAAYIGKAGQLVVVAENTILTNELMEALDSTFGDFIRPFYPPQPKFEIIPLEESRFDKGSKRLRNLMFIALSPNIEKGKPQVKLKKDFNAKGQLVVDIKAHTMDDLIQVIQEQSPKWVKLFEEIEWKREFQRHKKANNTVLKKQLSEQFGITLELPKEGRYESNRKNFAHILFPEKSRQMDIQTESGGYSSSKANFIQSGIMIWQLPYTDTNQFTPEYLMRTRDTILKYNALHEFPGVYMGTQDHPAVLPIHSFIKIGEVEGYEFRGLYKFTGRLEPSGGKFWSFHFIHPKRNKIIAISGYLDAPPTMSPALELRQIQAILYSVKLVD